jgi:hypothetical protein
MYINIQIYIHIYIYVYNFLPESQGYLEERDICIYVYTNVDIYGYVHEYILI